MNAVNSNHCLVSVIIPCYNAARYLEETLNNVLAELPSEGEVVCIDDGSTDETKDILSRYRHRVVVISGDNRGANAARNTGLREARGKYVKFLDADDLLCSGALTRQIDLAEERAESDNVVFFGHAESIDDKGEVLGLYASHIPEAGEDALAFILQHSPITSCPLHLREWLMGVGGLNEEIPTCHEHELHLKLVLSGKRFEAHDDLVYQYREHLTESRITRNPFPGNDPEFILKYTQYCSDLICNKFQHDSLPEIYAQVLAQNLWKAGRWAAKYRHKQTSKKYFDASYTFHPKIRPVGSALYRNLFRLFGPYYSERLLCILKFAIGR